MSETRSFDDILAGGSGVPAAKFKEHGDKVSGALVGKDTQHKAKFNPSDPSDKSELQYFKSGDPVLELILDLQTEERKDSDDNGVRRVYVPFQMQQALQQAVSDAGIKNAAGKPHLPLGAHVDITHTHSVPSKGGGSPRKEYKVVVSGAADKLVEKPKNGVAKTAVEADAPALTEQTKQLMREAGIPIPGE